MTLLEAGPRLLPAFDELSAQKAKRSLEKLGVEVLVNAMVTNCDASGVSDWCRADRDPNRRLGRRRSRVRRREVARRRDRSHRQGKGRARPSVPGHSNVFVIGDTAHALDRKGQPLPGVAPVAKQQGTYVARAILERASRGRARRRSTTATSAPWRRSDAAVP